MQPMQPINQTNNKQTTDNHQGRLDRRQTPPGWPGRGKQPWTRSTSPRGRTPPTPAPDPSTPCGLSGCARHDHTPSVESYCFQRTSHTPPPFLSPNRTTPHRNYDQQAATNGDNGSKPCFEGGGRIVRHRSGWYSSTGACIAGAGSKQATPSTAKGTHKPKTHKHRSPDIGPPNAAAYLGSDFESGRASENPVGILAPTAVPIPTPAPDPAPAGTTRCTRLGRLGRLGRGFTCGECVERLEIK